ncbi:MAG: glycoside hydrolase family 30 beta sandwich domain-containing protein [Bacteroidota bacterium]
MRSLLKAIFLLVSCSLVFGGCGGCTSSEEETDPIVEVGNIEVTLTSLNGSTLLQQLPENLGFSDQGNGAIINITESDKGPPIQGFGGALTGSSAFLLSGNKEALNALFAENEEGIGLNFVRLVMGASDFNRNGNYTYNDIVEAEDPDLSEFSIANDKIADNPVIPVAQSILGINNNISFIASPWTAPPWMKSSRSFIGGRLLPQYYSVYADYFAKYIEAYAEEGIEISGITPQNEPLHEPSTYPGMLMSASEQSEFIGNHLGPTFEMGGLLTKIIAYDHNYRVESDPEYPLKVLRDADASRYTNAIAYHAYGGNPTDIDKVLDEFPDTEIYFTEQAGIQNEGTSFSGEIGWFMSNVFSPIMRRGGKGILLWNLALNENGGPTNNGCLTCRGVITVTGSGTVVKNPEYYLLGHFSKFVNPGARRLITNPVSGTLENVAFENPDGSRVIVLMNSSSSEEEITINSRSNKINYTLPAASLATLKW